ncbi:MAG: hypothetical protein ACE5GB_05620 [Acidimicrobiales bacterium]
MGRDGEFVGWVNTDPMLGLDDISDVPLGGYDLLDERTWDRVHADDLTTVVGHIVPSYGFLPLGDDPPTADQLLPVIIVEERSDP